MWLPLCCKCEYDRIDNLMFRSGPVVSKINEDFGGVSRSGRLSNQNLSSKVSVLGVQQFSNVPQDTQLNES